MAVQADYDRLAENLTARGIDVEQVKSKLKKQHIETPSWAYTDSGTRFHIFKWPGAARSVKEKVADAAYVNRLTGVAPSMAIHIPWDKTDDWGALVQYAREQGISLGAVNPNLFQDKAYRLGSITHPDSGVREQALGHLIECCEIMAQVGSKDLSLWFADGTNYAGQDSIRNRKRRMEEVLAQTYKHLPEGARMLIEYKFFEPAFYHTDLPDWGTAYAMALKMGERAAVLVDTGHHAQGTNIAHIVAFLLDEQRLGGFHFNARKYADDDLIVGTVNPFELFEIFTELVVAGDRAEDVAYMLDQNHNVEGKLEAVIISIMNCQAAYAKALVVDYDRLDRFQLQGDVLGAHRTLIDAYETDVRPLLAQVRVEMGLHPDPIAHFRSDDYQRRIVEERG
jgi:L-rhamnose isomerase/sugar isomerase